MKLGIIVLAMLVLSCTPVDEPMTVEENVSALNNLGVYYAGQGDDEKAKEYFEKVLELELDHVTARNNLALIYFGEGDYTTAAEHLYMLTKLDDSNPSYFYDLGIALADNCRLNDICELDAAIAAFEKANEISPGYSKSVENIAALKQVKESMKDAEAESQE